MTAGSTRACYGSIYSEYNNYLSELIHADLLISKQEALFWAIKQAKGGLPCLLVYCLYIVNLVVAVVGNRPLVFQVNFWLLG